MSILIIEDERKTTHFLQKGFAENGFVVDIAENGEDGLHLALTENYQLIILDIMLPKKNGFEIIAELRNNKIETQIICLTAKDSVEDRVKGLEIGANDYLIKPFSFSELLARVRVLLKRNNVHNQAHHILTIQDLCIDFAKHTVTRSNQKILLTHKEFMLLSLLASRKNEVISRTLIAENVWDMNFESNTNVVDVAIRRLRAKIDDPFSKKIIHTIRGIGYILSDE